MPIQNTCHRTVRDNKNNNPELKAAPALPDAAFCLFGVQ